MAYGDFKDLAGRTASDNILRNKAFNIAKSPNDDRYQRGLASMVYKFFDKKSASGSSITTLANNSAFNNEIEQNRLLLELATQQLTEELHKPIIRKLKKQFILHLRTIFGVLI